MTATVRVGESEGEVGVGVDDWCESCREVSIVEMPRNLGSDIELSE